MERKIVYIHSNRKVEQNPDETHLPYIASNSRAEVLESSKLAKSRHSGSAHAHSVGAPALSVYQMGFTQHTPQEPHSAEYAHLKRAIPHSSGQAFEKLQINTSTPQSIKNVAE